MNYYLTVVSSRLKKVKLKAYGLYLYNYILFNFHQERTLLSFTDHVLVGIVTVVHHLFK